MTVTRPPAGIPLLHERVIDSRSGDWQWPYLRYEELRGEGPLWWSEPFAEWVVLAHEPAWEILRDPRWSSNPAHLAPDDKRLVDNPNLRSTALDVGASVLLFLDPPDHTRLRRLVSRAFTPRRIESLRVHVRALVHGILDEALERGSIDVVADLGYQLPVTVICELLGVPTEGRAKFAPWSSAATRLLDGDLDEETFTAGAVAAMQILNELNDLFEARRAEPRDDLISALVAVEEEGDRLTEQELRSIVILLFLAGHETTQNLIGNGTWALLRHPDQWKRLVADPALVPTAVEELLRFDGPVHATARIATVEGLEVMGQPVRKGEQVFCLLAAANRDPDVYGSPAALDVGRDPNHHLTFSQGMHYCLGATLARLEGQEVFAAMAERLGGLSDEWLVDEPRYRDHFILRGLESLHLQLP